MLIDLSRRYGAGRSPRSTSTFARIATAASRACPQARDVLDVALRRAGSGSHDRVQPRRRLQPGPFTLVTVPTGESSSDRPLGCGAQPDRRTGEESATSGSRHSGSRQP